MIRTLNKLGREEHPHIDKEHLQKAHKTYERTNIILNDERLNTFPPETGNNKARVSSLTIPIQHGMGNPTQWNKTKQGKKKDKT